MTRRTVWPRIRLVGGAAIIAALVWEFGTGPAQDAWRLTTWPSVLWVLGLTAVSTVSSALRWRVIAAGLGVPLTPGASVAAYYRSQILNAILPGGILGDADRAIRHGRGAGNLGAGVRATVWDRAAGQYVQGTVVVVALAAGPVDLQWLAPVVAVVGILFALVAVAVGRGTVRGRVLADDLRTLSGLDVLVPVTLASICSTASHVAVFLVAAHAVGVHAPWFVLVPTALFVLTASSLPLSVAGWGPREGVTAWAFSTVGLGATQGLTVALLCGVLGTVATAPGLVVLVVDAFRRRRLDRVPAVPDETVPVITSPAPVPPAPLAG